MYLSIITYRGYYAVSVTAYVRLGLGTRLGAGVLKKPTLCCTLHKYIIFLLVQVF